MLILTRNYGESIVIGDEIRVTVLPGKSGTIRLGVTAPRSVAVHREEVYERIKAAGRESAAEPELLVLPEI